MAECSPLPGWQDVAEAARGKYVVFGEWHGTSEAPAAFADYVCAIAQDAPVLAAFEFPRAQQEAFDVLWDGPHENFLEGMSRLIDDSSKMKDGRSSMAMAEAINHLHAVKTAGAEIDIVLFTGYESPEQRETLKQLPGQEGYETALAGNISDANGGYDQVAVLVGNIHAMEEAVSFGDVLWNTMAMKLGRDDDIVTLNLVHAGGTSWNCRHVEGEHECDIREVQGTDGATGSPRMGFWNGEAFSSESYDGYFFVGPVTASPPAGGR